MSNRIFNKPFYTSMYWGEMSSDYKLNNTSLENKKILLKDAKNHYTDGISICIHIHSNIVEDKNKFPNIAPDDFIIVEDLNEIQKGIDEAKKLGIPIKCIKVHYNDTWNFNYFFKISFEKLFNNMKKVLIQIADKFKGQADMFIAFNETQPLYRSFCWNKGDINETPLQDNSKYVIECIEAIKERGYKVGISTCMVLDASQIPDKVIKSLDLLGINFYPSISADINTYDEELISLIKSKYRADLEWIKCFKKKYPNKELHITETGCLDYEWSLLDSGMWSLDGTTKYCKNVNGKIQAKMLKALFIIFNDLPIDGLWHWWPLKYQATIDVCKYYLQDNKNYKQDDIKVLLKSYNNDFISIKNVFKIPSLIDNYNNYNNKKKLFKYYKIANINTAKVAGNSYKTFESENLLRIFTLGNILEESLIGIKVKSYDENYKNSIFIKNEFSFFKLYLVKEDNLNFSLYIQFNKLLDQNIYVQPLFLDNNFKFNEFY